jgi:fatty acid desaturase
MIILGIILLLIGFVAGIAILWTLGIIVLAAGVILMLLGRTGHAVGGRSHYYRAAGGSRAARARARREGRRAQPVVSGAGRVPGEVPAQAA